MFSIETGTFRRIMVCDFDTLQDMLSKDVFSGRGNFNEFGIDIFSRLKGGHGAHGLIFSEGKQHCEY